MSRFLFARERRVKHLIINRYKVQTKIHLGIVSLVLNNLLIIFSLVPFIRYLSRQCLVHYLHVNGGSITGFWNNERNVHSKILF